VIRGKPGITRPATRLPLQVQFFELALKVDVEFLIDNVKGGLDGTGGSVKSDGDFFCGKALLRKARDV
jgi:hypothetical protein